jgi:Ca2+-binding EF-hand superfamily protein
MCLCSDAKFRRLYRAVDRNKDGAISMIELNQILFPEKAEEEDIQVTSTMNRIL